MTNEDFISISRIIGVDPLAVGFGGVGKSVAIALIAS
jgi:hypothetical protein